MFKGDKNFLVGLFVSIAIAVLVAFVVWLTGRTGNQEMERYSLMFQKDVSGLAVGGPVKYMGMNIGKVVRMDLVREETSREETIRKATSCEETIPEDTVREETIREETIKVQVDIEILASTPVDCGTWASLALQGITGVAVVNLATEPGEHRELEAPPGKEFPVIPVRVVGFSALMSSAPEIMAKLNRLLSHAEQILGEDNQATISSTLNHIDTLTGSLAKEHETIAAIPANLNQTITDIRITVTQLRETIGELKPNIGATAENLKVTSGNLVSLTDRMDTLLREHEDDLGRFMEDGLGEAPALMAETRTTLRDLEKLVQELQDDPSQLIYRAADSSLEIEP